MSEVPPPQFAAYPRPNLEPYGSPEKLCALGEGYFGLNWIFLLNVVLLFGARIMLFVDIRAFYAGLGLLFLVVIFGTVPFNKKIASGKGWTAGYAILASVLMGINRALCCGVIGYVVMQQIAANEMKKYGLKTGFLGIKKKNWKAALEARESSPTIPQ